MNCTKEIGSTIAGKTRYDSDAKIWHGIQSDSEYGPECSIGEEVLKVLLKDPEKIAQICYTSGKKYTNSDIATQSIRIAQHFQKFDNIQQTDIIGFCGSNSDYTAALFFGTMLSGLTISTLDPSFDKDGIQHIFSITKPKIMFCDGADYARIKLAFDEINLKCSIYTMKDHIQDTPNITEFLNEIGNETNFKIMPLKEGCQQTAAVLCSSGTTGLPKGVCMSHASLLNKNVFNFASDDKLLCLSTLYWLSGVICLLHGTLHGATRIISENAFKAAEFFDIIQKYKTTVVFTPPSQIALSVASPIICDYDLTSITTYLCGGGAVPRSLIEKIKLYMPNAVFSVGYGTSEMCGVVTLGYTPLDGSTGQVSLNTEVKIIDDNGYSLGVAQHGEVCVRSLYPWRGYYGNKAATADIYDQDRWIHTGDIGYVDEDGNLFIIDRKKDILKYNNFHFFPTEIENVISELPGVAEVCVCGIPDIVSSHLPAAAIVPSNDSTLSEDDVYEFVANNMAHFKHLRGGVYFVPELPKTASGKNLRRAVTELCEKSRNSKLSVDTSSQKS